LGPRATLARPMPRRGESTSESNAKGFKQQIRNGSMNLILWLILGGLLGWLASLVMHTNAQQGLFLNIVVGIVGAVLAGLWLVPLFGVDTINQNNLSLPALMVSLLGSLILLAGVNLLRHGAVR
jgi:uncharacterized membrane protein YeaQ/YmgE (transglycosylase-associated protein family)